MAGEARAGTLTIYVDVNGATAMITPGSPLAQMGSTNNQLTVDTGALDAALGVSGFTFSGFSATSNNPGSTSGATLSVNATGTADVGAGPFNVKIDTFIADYNMPVGSASLHSSSTAIFSGATAGSTQTFQSWFNQDNSTPPFPPPSPPSGPGFVTPSPLINFAYTTPPQQSFNTDATPTALGTIHSPYSLTNELNFTLVSSPTTQEQDIVGGKTTVLATTIPEPASVVSFMIGIPLPVVVACMLRRRRRAGA
jgi:hypothetical protein